MNNRNYCPSKQPFYFCFKQQDCCPSHYFTAGMNNKNYSPSHHTTPVMNSKNYCPSHHSTIVMNKMKSLSAHHTTTVMNNRHYCPFHQYMTVMKISEKACPVRIFNMPNKLFFINSLCKCDLRLFCQTKWFCDSVKMIKCFFDGS
jgi:hypothetical protein